MELIIQVVVGIVPAIISGFIAYYTAKKNADTELEKVERKAEKDIERIEEESKAKINELQQKQESYLAYYKGKLEADNQQNQNDFINTLVGDFLGNVMKDVKSPQDLKELEERMENFKNK